MPVYEDECILHYFFYVSRSQLYPAGASIRQWVVLCHPGINHAEHSDKLMVKRVNFTSRRHVYYVDVERAIFNFFPRTAAAHLRKS